MPKEYSQCAQGMLASSLELDELAQTLSQYVTLKTKYLTRPTWSKISKKAGYIQHLFSRVLKPSMKSHLEARYTASLEAIHVPHFQALVTEKAKKPKKKIRKGRLAVVTICVFLFLSLIALSIVGLINLMPDDGDESTSSNELFILTPDQVVDVYDGDTFKIDLPRMHPLFGDALSIRLFGVDTPEMRGTTEEVKALAMKAQKVTRKALAGARKIELRNPQRGKYFRIVSEVWIDGESLADMLRASGLAKDYDGVGARPKW